MQITWREIYDSFKNSPRDIHTVPVRNIPQKWFYVQAINGEIYIMNAKSHSNSCSISIKRRLDYKNLDKMYELKLRRNLGFSVSAEAGRTTVNQIYWYGILNEFGV